ANNLGGLYEMGWGVEADQQKALAYYSQASEKGNKHAGENFRRLSAVLGSSAIGPRVEQSNASDPAVLTKAKVGSAPPQSNGQASSAVEPAPAPKHKKATDFRAGTKKQTRAGQLPAAKNSTQRTSKESAT